MPELTEAQLYNMCQGAAGSGRSAATGGQQALLMLHVKHLRFEHKMPIRMIAQRTNLRMKTVKVYLEGRIVHWEREVGEADFGS